jgi:hypothetical protein
MNELAGILLAQKSMAKDYLATSERLSLTEEGKLDMKGIGEFGLDDLMADQLMNSCGIPNKYAEKMRVEALLLAFNVNYWLKKKKGERHLVRTMGPNARAFLSDRYRPLDNADLVDAVLPSITKVGCEIVSAELTGKKLYIKALFPKLQAEVKKGDIVQAGLCLSNSEVGCGSVRVEPLIYRLVCLNGMVANDMAMRKYHVGRRNDEGEGNERFYRDETREADDRAFWLKVRDTVAGVLTQDVFGTLVEKMREATGQKIEAAPQDVVEVTRKTYGLSEDEGKSILTHLTMGGDLSQYGLVNAVTRASQDVESYDRATELEKLGGEILELAPRDWSRMAAKK